MICIFEKRKWKLKDTIKVRRRSTSTLSTALSGHADNKHDISQDKIFRGEVRRHCWRTLLLPADDRGGLENAGGNWMMYSS